MLFWLIQHFGLMERLESHTTGDSHVYLTARTAGASVTAFVMAMVLGPLAIRWLKKRFRERIASASETLNRLHAAKQDTPTMGGIFLISSVMLSTILWGELSCPYVYTALFLTATMTLLGASDDWIKQRTSRNGLTARQKLAGQLLISMITAILLYSELKHLTSGTELNGLFSNNVLSLGILFVPWAMLVLVGTANGVNLTDGLDGLATGCSMVSIAAFAVLTYLSGHRELAEYLRMPHIAQAGELSVVLGAMTGSLLGFLWYNCHPAKVFMGDAGSLPIGALLALAALVCRQECLLIVIGGVFVVETLSVIVQIGGYRMTGRRLLRCSPLHNHFVFRGDHETTIVTRFWIVSAVLAIVGMATLKFK